MNRFHTARDAKEYLIRRILTQAGQDGILISNIERDMLYFSETGWTLPNMMAVSREFDQACDQDEYKSEIGQIIRRIHDQHDRSQEDEDWKKAVQRLRDEDHYLLIIIDGALRTQVKTSRMRLIWAGAVVVAVFLPVSFFVYSHVDNSVISKLIVGSAFLAVVFLVWFVAN